MNADLAEQLNADCQCLSLDSEALGRELGHAPDGAALAAMITADRPHLFSGAAVFVSGEQVRRMAQIVAAVERVVALPAWSSHALAYAPEVARYEPAARGVFLGYDFHLGAEGPQLIEINTNAGGALLNALLARAQYACCDAMRAHLPGALAGDPPEHMFLQMFRQEWRLQRGEAKLTTIAIVDTEPTSQYLYPEFLLFARLFERHKIEAIICAPEQLAWRDGALWFEDHRIDLVYNRLTDFALEAPACAALRDAYLADAVVLTPHPHAHARYADKRNLIALCDDAQLTRWGVDAATRALLVSGIPRTEQVVAQAAEDFWARRRKLFFKPAAGYGSKAAYRGDKLTRRVFEEIMANSSHYVAQALVPPSSRRLSIDGDLVAMKIDLRNYVYDGRVQLISARLWQGQTTNFRTPGGGFAPVLAVPTIPPAPFPGKGVTEVRPSGTPCVDLSPPRDGPSEAPRA